DTMQVDVEPMAPFKVFQADTNVPMMRINVKTDAHTAVWNQLRTDLLTNSGAVSGDVSLIKLFKDVGNDKIFDPAIEGAKDVDGNYINLVSNGTEGFTDGVTNLILKPQVVTAQAAGQNYFLTYDINAFAQVGKNVGATLGSTNYF